MSVKTYRYWLVAVLICNVSVFFLMFMWNIDCKIPSEVTMKTNQEEILQFPLPVTGEVDSGSLPALKVNHKTVPSDKIKYDFGKPVSFSSNETGNFSVRLKLFGVVPIREISLDVLSETKVLPLGESTGIYIKTDGVLVLGIGEVKKADGSVEEPAMHIVRTGDYIISVNGAAVSNKTTLQNEIGKQGGDSVTLGIRRDGKNISVKVDPVLSEDNQYKIGLWVRDDTQGIGTLTYMLEDGACGLLGHGITDSDTGTMMEISYGSLYRIDIVDVVKSREGKPGELLGNFVKSGKNKTGVVKKNCPQGIYGTLDLDQYNTGHKTEENTWTTIALKQEVKTGDAYILCQLGDSVEKYDIEIEKTMLNTQDDCKGMVIRMKDKKLLEKTNGIIQGMSGAPIIQDGKLIGAVTHVFVHDPTCGYGIFIENMLEQS
ncbi:MAG: SpoIVB peptidase [Clostridiales bacterium]|nr:SpoIVB peptidase [Clostridiales bacterium]